VLFSSMAWSPPALKRRLWFVEQTRDYATNLFPPHPRRHPKLHLRAEGGGKPIVGVLTGG